MRVRDVMRTDCPVLHQRRTIKEAIKLMLAKNKPCVVTIDDEESTTGVLLQRRVMNVVYQAGVPPSEVRLLNATHPPEVKIQPGSTVRKAAQQLIENEQQVGFVMDGLSISGIVTIYELLESDSLTLSRTDTDSDRNKSWSD